MLLSSNLKVVSAYVIPNSLSILERILEDAFVKIRISRPRKSKFGDFRPSLISNIPSRISVNADLNKHAFLITLIHELAHYKTFRTFRFGVKPHGKEWKLQYRELLKPFITADIFPDNVKEALKTYILKPAASSCTDLNLMRALYSFDNVDYSNVIEKLPPFTSFEWSDGRLFIKGEKLRKRYRCKEVGSGKVYLFSPIAVVKPLP